MRFSFSSANTVFDISRSAVFEILFVASPRVLKVFGVLKLTTSSKSSVSSIKSASTPSLERTVYETLFETNLRNFDEIISSEKSSRKLSCFALQSSKR